MTINTVSIILEKTPRQIHNYIRDGHLKAKLENNMYDIKRKDLDEFINGYYKNRHKRKGVRVATCDDVERLVSFVEDLKNPNIDFESFYKKYRNIESIIPPLPSFVRFKRNKLVIGDSRDMKQSEIALKYRISVRSVQEIIKNQKKEDSV